MKTDEESTLHHIYNQNTRDYDVLDLSTGKILEIVKDETTPKEYSLLLGDRLCDMIREGKTISNICKDPSMPTATRFYAWLALYPQLRIRYEQARKQRADAFHDKIIDIADNLDDKDQVPVAKVRIDAYKWAAEKASPDYYGKKEEKASIGSINVTLHTGVLDSVGPKDIIIDEFGNFKGFGEVQDIAPELIEVEIIQTTDRWETKE